jgi:MFS family permease
LLVQKFDYDVATITAFFLVNAVINIFFAPIVGRLIGQFGERRALVFEYIGLICVFLAYAVVESAFVAGALYVIDHLFFTLAIETRTYFQNIADPADIASTAGVAFTINHIASVLLPAFYGLLWLASPALVFLSGVALATMSLVLAILMPHDPEFVRGV